MSTRREFLKQSAAASALLSVSGLEALAESKKEKKPTPAPSDKIRIAVAGVNSRGKSISNTLSKLDGCDVVCICDCETGALERCRDKVEANCGKRPEAEKDYRQLLKRTDIDAVAIAMPDHWHATAAIMALHAGKHVYLEKPASYCPEENAMLLQAERKAGKAVQVGMQRHSYPNIVKAMDELHSGIIGDVHYAKSWYVANRVSIGKGKPAPVPSGLNWEFWQGPAPRGPLFKDNLVPYNWHWHWHWGTGEALNNGTHYIDLVRWGMCLNEYPVMVSSVGGRYHFMDDDWETPDTQMVTFRMKNGESFSWEGRSCDPAKVDGESLGVTFYGQDGQTMVLRGGNEYYIKDKDGKMIKEVKSDLVFREGDRLNPSEELDSYHFLNWFDAIRNGAPLANPLCQACMSTQYAQYGNISQRVGKSISINPMTGAILDCPEAQALWSREYDPDWTPKQYL